MGPTSLHLSCTGQIPPEVFLHSPRTNPARTRLLTSDYPDADLPFSHTRDSQHDPARSLLAVDLILVIIMRSPGSHCRKCGPEEELETVSTLHLLCSEHLKANNFEE